MVLNNLPTPLVLALDLVLALLLMLALLLVVALAHAAPDVGEPLAFLLAESSASQPRAQKSTLIQCQCILLNCIIVNRRLLYDDNCAGRDDYFRFWLRFQIPFVLLAYFMVLPLCATIQPHVTDITMNEQVVNTDVTINKDGLLHCGLESKWLLK